MLFERLAWWHFNIMFYCISLFSLFDISLWSFQGVLHSIFPITKPAYILGIFIGLNMFLFSRKCQAAFLETDLLECSYPWSSDIYNNYVWKELVFRKVWLDSPASATLDLGPCASFRNPSPHVCFWLKFSWCVAVLCESCASFLCG